MEISDTAEPVYWQTYGSGDADHSSGNDVPILFSCNPLIAVLSWCHACDLMKYPGEIIGIRIAAQIGNLRDGKVLLLKIIPGQGNPLTVDVLRQCLIEFFFEFCRKMLTGY